MQNWNIYYAIQQGNKDAWSAIAESLPMYVKWNLYAMPDTYFLTDVFCDEYNADFIINAFWTTTPEKFGVITDVEILDKKKFTTPGNYLAWGTLISFLLTSFTANVFFFRKKMKALIHMQIIKDR